MKPLAIDLYAGLGGWAGGFLSEGYRVIGFDIERHRYPRPVQEVGPVKRPGMNWSDQTKRGAKDAMFNCPQPTTGEWDEYPGELVLQDVLTLHGSQFRHADCIVASPPCQEYSYMAMPWKRAKQIAAALHGECPFPDGYTGSRNLEQLNALFNACFRIQLEASQAAGRHIPLVVENVKGAQPWVGRAKANYGSYYLWGDVESVGGRIVAPGAGFGAAAVRAARHVKNSDTPGKTWFGISHGREFAGQPGNPVNETKSFATGLGRGHDWRQDPIARFNYQSNARKAASAMIAKIPFELASHIARCFNPVGLCAVRHNE